MKPRTLKLSFSLGMFNMPIATFAMAKLATVRKASTKRICPNCGDTPEYHGGYTCTCCPQCGKKMEAVPVGEKGDAMNFKCAEHGYQDPTAFNHFSKLKEVYSDDGSAVERPKLTTGEIVEAKCFIMDITDFANYADATCDEWGITAKDANSASNLKKLLVAMRYLGKVIVIHFTDTYEERIAVLTTSLSNRIILRELIPLNLLESNETMSANITVSDKDIEEAKGFINQIPKAEKGLLMVNDYRINHVDVTDVQPEVLALEAIIAKAAQIAPTAS